HNCYLFGIQECGESRIFIDFKEYRLCGATLVCILPGQIHFSAEQKNVSGWLFGMDTLFVTGEMKEIFDMLLFSENTVTLDEQSMNDLNSCLSLLGRKMTPEHGEPAQQVARSLATAAAGMIAGLYRQKQPAPSGKRMTDIVRRFKQLLHDNLTDRKNPSQYADMLHITTQYLNKAVKHVTGSTTGSLIQHEAVLEAKRLLFYTDESVKEIAFHLGYDDCAYFTRLFTKVCGMSPVRFRESYRE
ncbi:MAG: AraC family transcriptional regulator, partial [Prevotellaceae bacterium]|nr:AraC family transcriptional regulator [Prevotellaceae bacterium]